MQFFRFRLEGSVHCLLHLINTVHGGFNHRSLNVMGGALTRHLYYLTRNPVNLYPVLYFFIPVQPTILSFHSGFMLFISSFFQILFQFFIFFSRAMASSIDEKNS